MEPFDLRKWAKFQEASPDAGVNPVLIDQIVIDSRRISSKNALFIALSGSNFDGHIFLKEAYRRGARFAIVNKDVEIAAPPLGMKLFKVPDPLRALQEIAAQYRKEMPAKVIAVTGSYGKTMLKDLIQHLISQDELLQKLEIFTSPESFNSQLGVALSLLKIRNFHQIAIIEAGISKPNEMQYHLEMINPDHVIVTNIGTAHIGSLGQKRLSPKKKRRFFPRYQKKIGALSRQSSRTFVLTTIGTKIAQSFPS